MKTKFVAYTVESDVPCQGGEYRKLVISPFDPDAIPAEIQAAFPESVFEQIIHTAVDPAFLDKIVGVYDTYLDAALALSHVPHWKMFVAR